MKQVIKEILKCRQRLCQLEEQLKDTEYWVDKAIAETSFKPEEDSFVHIEWARGRLEVSVFASHNSLDNAVYWINGRWFNTLFPPMTPSLEQLEEGLNSL